MQTVKTAKRPTLTGHDMLARYVADKPRYLKNKINKAMNAGGVAWRHSAKPNIDSPDICTWDGLSFLGNGKAKTAWQTLWQGSRAPALTWDAIGRVQIGKVGWEWLLVTSMSKLADLGTTVKRKQSTETQDAFLNQAKAKYKVSMNTKWSSESTYLMQLATLAFLRNYNVCSRLLSVHYYSDEHSDELSEKQLPTIHQWIQAIESSHVHLGLSGKSPVEKRIYRLFLPGI